AIHYFGRAESDSALLNRCSLLCATNHHRFFLSPRAREVAFHPGERRFPRCRALDALSEYLEIQFPAEEWSKECWSVCPFGFHPRFRRYCRRPLSAPPRLRTRQRSKQIQREFVRNGSYRCPLPGSKNGGLIPPMLPPFPAS